MCRLMSSARSRNYSRGRKPSDLTRSRVEQHARAGVERRSGRAHVVHHNHDAPRHVSASSQGKRVLDVRMTLGGGKIGLRHRGTYPFQRVDGRNRKIVLTFPQNLSVREFQKIHGDFRSYFHRGDIIPDIDVSPQYEPECSEHEDSSEFEYVIADT